MRSIRFTALLLPLFLLPRAADAQVIMGEVVRAGDHAPIAGAFIRLLDADGVQRGAALADSLGRFTIRAQRPSEYSLRAEMIGHVSTTSDPLQLGTTTLRYTMVVPIRVLWLDETTAELRLLEYGYTSIPWNLADGLARGRIDFGRTPTGTWIMQRWSIRIPRVQHMQGVRGPRRYMRLDFEEAGGEVRAIRLGGVRIPVEGRAVDGAAPEPIGVPTRVGFMR
jgi:hypothetical protein